MNVGVLASVSRNDGGIYFAVRWLTKTLANYGTNIHIVSHVDNNTYKDIKEWAKIPISLYSCVGPLNSSWKLRRLLHSLPADILHVHGIWLDRQWAALQWQRKTGKPVVISPHGMLDPWAVQNSLWKKKIVGKLFANESLEKATCIHALCQAEVDSIRGYGLTNPIAIIPNGVFLPELHSTFNNGKKNTNNKKRLLYLGRIHPKKGLSELLQAWKVLLKRQPSLIKPWQLIFAGWDDGGHLQGLQKQALDLGISWADLSEQDLYCEDGLTSDAKLLFCGPVFGEKKDTLLRSVDAFILPSFSEGLPMSILEAWSYRLPVLMTEFCNIPEGFKAGAAIQIAPDPESIAKGLDQLIDLSGSDLYSIGSSGRRLVEQKFQWENIAQDMKSVYEWCLGGNKPDCLSCY